MANAIPVHSEPKVTPATAVKLPKATPVDKDGNILVNGVAAVTGQDHPSLGIWTGNANGIGGYWSSTTGTVDQKTSTL